MGLPAGEVPDGELAAPATTGPADGSVNAPATNAAITDKDANHRRMNVMSQMTASERFSFGAYHEGVSTDIDLAAIDAARQDLLARYLKPAGERPPSSARGVHHIALLSSDVERTILFYQELLEFPLTEIFENRDYKGSNHFFFDLGNGNLLAFFDFPGLDLGPYSEVLGGLHHIAISVEPDRWNHLKAKLDERGVDYMLHSGSSIYLSDPDGARVELISDPLLNMYGHQVG